MFSSKWPTKNECQRIRYKAKKMGAEKVDLKYFPHNVWFKHTRIVFNFYPLKYSVYFREPNVCSGHFSVKETADEIKKDIDLALEFIDWLKEFNAQLSEN